MVLRETEKRPFDHYIIIIIAASTPQQCCMKNCIVETWKIHKEPNSILKKVFSKSRVYEVFCNNIYTAAAGGDAFLCIMFCIVMIQ